MSSPSRTRGGRRMMAALRSGTPEADVTLRRNGTRPRPPSMRPGDARASREAISLRTTSARSVVTGSQRLGRFLSLTFGGIRDVCSAASPGSNERLCSEPPMTRNAVLTLFIILVAVGYFLLLFLFKLPFMEA
jgi:hypothetical protein